MAVTARCALCGLEGAAIPVAEADQMKDGLPAYWRGDFPTARSFVSCELALLHHVCASRQANTETPWWDGDRAWWACKQPGRHLDDDAHFDLNCVECAVRWSTTLDPPAEP